MEKKMEFLFPFRVINHIWEFKKTRGKSVLLVCYTELISRCSPLLITEPHAVGVKQFPVSYLLHISI